ncbi:MAG: hypothetical protein ACQSGP_07690 [Frankia sp.]
MPETHDRSGSGPTGSDRTAPDLPDGAVAAAGKMSEALEWVERARGRLYDFHHLVGHAELVLGEALGQIADAGRPDLSRRLRESVFGRNVLDGRWTFQLVEEYDDGYHRAFVEAERQAREELTAGRRHVFEARMKDDERRRAGREPWSAGP